MCDITSCINFVQKSSFSERVFLKLYFIESHFLSFYLKSLSKTNLASWENYPAKLLWHQRPYGSFRNDVGCCILSVISISIDSHRFFSNLFELKSLVINSNRIACTNERRHWRTHPHISMTKDDRKLPFFYSICFSYSHLEYFFVFPSEKSASSFHNIFKVFPRISF